MDSLDQSPKYTLKAIDLAKRFGQLKVFKGLNFELSTGQSIAVIGPNGSGKSTLLMILLSIYRPTKGRVEFLCDDEKLDEDGVRDNIALVAPYLNLYGNLTGEENLKFFATVSGRNITGKDINELLETVGLAGRGSDFVSGYSSGMAQRLKYAVALFKQPQFLFLDEPTSNLDAAGKKIVFEIVERQRSKSIIIIATNEVKEIDLAQQQIRVDQ